MVREMDFVDEYYAGKDLSLLKKLTIVIPTYNRNYYLSRCLWYHAHFPFGQIIVADSSPEEKKIVNQETVAKIRVMFGVDVLYLEYEPETEKYGGDIYRKWGDAVMQSTTEYTKISTDKEFVLPESAVISIDFLDEHLDYNSVDGQNLLLSNSFNVSTGCDELIWRLWGSGQSYDMADPIERVSNLFDFTRKDNAGLGGHSSVRRTEYQKYIYGLILKYSLNDIRFGDFIPPLLNILCSKQHDLNVPVHARDILSLYNNEGKINTSESSYARYPSLRKLVHDGVIDEKISSLTDMIAKILYGFNIYTKEEVSLYTEKIVSEILNRYQIHAYKKTAWIPPELFEMFHSKIYSKIPHTLKYHCLKPFGVDIGKEERDDSYGSHPFNADNYPCLIPVETLIKSTLSNHDNDEVIHAIKY